MSGFSVFGSAIYAGTVYQGGWGGYMEYNKINKLLLSKAANDWPDMNPIF